MLLRLFVLSVFLLSVMPQEAFAVKPAAPSNANVAPVQAPALDSPAQPDQSSATGVAIPDNKFDANGQPILTDHAIDGDEYADLTWPNLARTMVHFNALNLEDPIVIDEYSIITECDLYKAYYQDDFKWNTVRQAVRDSIKMNSEHYPIKYRYPIKMQLDRYDFATKQFRLGKGSILNNVNTFKLFTDARKFCGFSGVRSLPHDFRVVLAASVYLDSLPFSETEAQNVLRRMDDDQDVDRILYTDFDITILYIEPLRKHIEGSGLTAGVKYLQSNVLAESDIRIDARLDSINFYTDEARKHLIYKYVP